MARLSQTAVPSQRKTGLTWQLPQRPGDSMRLGNNPPIRATSKVPNAQTRAAMRQADAIAEKWRARFCKPADCRCL